MGERHDFLPPDRELEDKDPFNLSLHPHQLTDNYLSLEQKGNDENATYNAYTDGSKMDEETGAAYAVFKEGILIKERKLKLARYCSVYQAEMLAIRECLVFLEKITKPGERATIHTDSQSAIMTIKQRKCKDQMANEIQYLITKINGQSQVNLTWVKGHAESTGNEYADYLAKQSLKLKKENYDKVPRSYLKARVKEQISEEMSTLYTGKINNITKKWLPDLETANKINKADPYIIGNKAIAAFITGHGYFNPHISRIYNQGEPKCDLCDLCADQTSTHILWECPFFSDQRNRIRDQLDYYKQEHNVDLQNNAQNEELLLRAQMSDKKWITIIENIKSIYKYLINKYYRDKQNQQDT
ncbi:uncharacterized protein LOC107370415 [Tetranychus urticae]|uniref:uncharacterized protein LOC107370415 n=1 Tax=Tetranychus urticae TaxID=32264 RepID=UPI00077BD502|nr:uncharacterized protein LOC107370415 [Tetranychus urticae]